MYRRIRRPPSLWMLLISAALVACAARDAEAAEALRSHHVLDPLGLAASAAEKSASFPTGTPDGGLIFARHGPTSRGRR